GVRPEDDDITHFLASLVQRSGMQTIPTVAPSRQTRPPGPPPPRHHNPSVTTPISLPTTPRRGILRISNQDFHYATAKEAMVTLLRQLAAKDPTFLERCSRHPNASGRKRRYIARTT